jgi:hypothetical protein
MTNNSDNMVIVPRFTTPRDSGPRRRANEARKTYSQKRKRRKLLKKARRAQQARRLQAGKPARTARRAAAAKSLASKSAKTGAKIGSRLMGPVGVALLVMDAINIVGNTMRRAEGGVSGRLLDAMDQDGIYGGLDELATGASKARGHIESNYDLLRIIGREDRVNSQIGQLGAYFREKETAIAIGSDLIEREPSLDHLGTIADKGIEKSVSFMKSVTDKAINAIRSFQGKEEITR